MDFNVSPVQAVTREFLAVILAGFGNELFPLTGDVGDEPCPKALLTISNKPMVDYVLSWVEESGITDVLLICPSSHRPSISHYIHSESSASSSSLHIDIQTFDESQELSVGTCSILRHFSGRIQQDFVLLPCDFVPPPSLPLSKLLNKFRTETTSDGAIVVSCWFETPDEWGSHSQSTPIVWDDCTGTLLYIGTLDGADRNSEELELRTNSHVYVCKREVLDALQEKAGLDSLREDFLPWLCKVHYQTRKRSKYGSGKIFRHLYIMDNRLMTPTGSDDDHAEASGLRVGVVIHRAKDGYCLRANNLLAYLEANRHVGCPEYSAELTDICYTLPSDPQKRALIDTKASISPDSTIGDFTKVDEKTTIKKSVIGKHCVIGKAVKIVGCVVLDHCVISDGAKLESSIVGRSTTVGGRAELVRCVTQGGYEVKEDENYRNEKLDASDWGAETGDENDDNNEHGEDSEEQNSNEEDG
ncbi:nucleotide-diphospho-sugar transferase [Melanogaster broomeanus]|nr:nucleotide-diphospho-sugar transferase [Melanogaster broomeanus]